jgi:hypothetical protein
MAVRTGGDVKRRATTAVIIALSFSGLAGTSAILPRAPAADVPAETPSDPPTPLPRDPGTTRPSLTDDDPDFDPRELEGADPKVAALQAHRLLQSIASRQATDSPSRLSRLNYLLEKLSPAQVSRSDADIVTADRIVDAMATWTTSSGPPFPKAADVLLPLIGIGSPAFRETVIGAVKAIARHEIASSRGSPAVRSTLDIIAGRFTDAPAPSEAFARDAARILWETDGRKLLDVLVATIARHAETAPRPSTPGGREDPAFASPRLALATVCLEELRSRTALDFPTVDGWKKWWGECAGLSLERILEDAQRRNREVHASNWKQLIRRLRETGDSERTLLAIQDTIDNVYASELRVAAVLALGEFAEWAFEGRVGEGKPDSNLEEGDPGARLLAKAVQMLAGLFQPRDFYSERPEVLRAALVSLRKYNRFLEKNPELRDEVSRIVVSMLQALFLGEREAGNEDLLETIRLAGALRVAGAGGFIEGLVRESATIPPRESPTSPAAESPTSPDAPASLAAGAGASRGDDLELVTAAVTALGRLADKGMSPETSSLILEQFRKPRAGPEKSLREFRRACVTALGAGSESAVVRSELLAFFRDTLLRGEDRDLRIPAVLGLGTLARQKEEGALAALEDVLARQDEFEPREVVAVIDSIAYVGGEAALASFVKPTVRTPDKAVEEHLIRKTVGLIEGGGVEALAWTLEKLEWIGLEEDSTRPAAFAVALAGEPKVKPLLVADGLDLGAGGKAEAWWRSVTALARAIDLTGNEEALRTEIERLSERVSRDPAIKDRVPRAAGDLAEIKLTLERRAEVRADLSRPDGVDPAVLIEALADLATAPAAALDRWRNLRWIHRQVSSVTPREAAGRIAALWRIALESEDLRPAWAGFPPVSRERHLSRLDALKMPEAAGAGAGTAPRKPGEPGTE